MRYKITVDAAGPAITDFPQGGMELGYEVDEKVTDRLCAVCDGVRKSVTTVIRYTVVDVLVHGQRIQWEDFKRDHPLSSGMLEIALEIGAFIDPTCDACRQDMFMPGVHRFNAGPTHDRTDD